MTFWCMQRSSLEDSSTFEKYLHNITQEMPYPGMDGDARDGRSDSPLHQAAFHPNCDVDLVKKILDLGAPVNTVNAFGQTPLHYMVQYTHSPVIIKLLLDNGAPVNALDDFHESPLHYALNGYQCNPEVIKLLLEGGANVDEQNEDEEEPLHLAAKIGDVTIINMLLEKEADINALDVHYESPLHCALNAVVCNPRVIQLLLDRGVDIFQENEDGQQALHVAAYKCNADIVSLLLDHGALVNAVDDSFQSPLNHALNALECDPKVVNLLLEKGADVHKVDFNGEQILHLAAYKCQPDIIQLLLDHGASVNALDSTDRSPLHCALSVNNNNPGVVKLLVEKGANLSQTDGIGQQPLHLASFRSDPSTIRFLLDHGAPANALNMLRCSPLLNAVFHNDDCSKRAVLKTLLESGAKVFRGLPPLIMAATALNEEDIRTDPEKFGKAYQCVKLLIKYGLLERPMTSFNGICTDPQIATSLSHFSRSCLVEICSKCSNRNFFFGQFIVRQRKNLNVNEILQVLSEKPYLLYKEVIAGLLTKRQLKEKLDEQIATISMSTLKHTVTLNHVALNNIVKYFSNHDDLLNLSLAFYNICQSFI